VGIVTNESRDTRSLIELVRALPTLFGNLIRAELAQLKRELAFKAKHAGIGIGFFVVAAGFAFFALGVLVAAAVLGIAVALPAWLAALIVGVALLLIAALLIVLGVRFLQKGIPPTPTESMESMKEDVEAVKGMGTYDR
jgi:Protein of unknown function (DUF1469).